MIGATVHFGSPPTHRPSETFLAHLARARASRAAAGARVLQCRVRAVRGVDAVYTDVWTSMGEEAFRERNAAMLRPYAVTNELMSHAAPHAVVLALPARAPRRGGHAPR